MKKPETLYREKNRDEREGSNLPDLIGQLGKQEPPVAAKEEPVKIPPAANKVATRLPRLLRQVDPVYPEDALRDRIDGDVTLNLTIGFNGKVERAVVVKSIPKLDAAAVTAARKWEFEPGLLEGIPIQATLQVTIHFTLPPEAARPRVGGEAVKAEPPVQTKPKPADTPPSVPQDDVSRAASLLERGFWIEALAMVKRILAVQPNLAEAKSIALDAVIQLAPGEIKSLVDQYAASYKAGQTAEFFRLHARPDVYNRLRGDLEMMTSAAREVQITVSNLNLDFQMARYPDFKRRAVFSQVMTGIPLGQALPGSDVRRPVFLGSGASGERLGDRRRQSRIGAGFKSPRSRSRHSQGANDDQVSSGVPSAGRKSRMIPPSSISMTRSQPAAICRSWVTIRNVVPFSRLISRRSSLIASLDSVSRFPVGSSARMRRGSLISARAMATRCCCPPDRFVDLLFIRSADADPFEKIPGPLFGRGRRPAVGRPEGEEDIFEGGEFGEEMMELEDKPDHPAAERGQAVVVESEDVAAVDSHRSGSRAVEGPDDVEQSGFTGAGPADQGRVFAGRRSKS